METSSSRAREIARAYLLPYLRLSKYVNSWRRAGFDDADFADNVPSRLIEALVALGDEDALVVRIREHWQAGARITYAFKRCMRIRANRRPMDSIST